VAYPKRETVGRTAGCVGEREIFPAMDWLEFVASGNDAGLDVFLAKESVGVVAEGCIVFASAPTGSRAICSSIQAGSRVLFMVIEGACATSVLEAGLAKCFSYAFHSSPRRPNGDDIAMSWPRVVSKPGLKARKTSTSGCALSSLLHHAISSQTAPMSSGTTWGGRLYRRAT
jgi:hypothetical protein